MCYNDWKTTINMVNQIIGYSCLDYVIVVDNNSSNDCYLKLKQNINKEAILIRSKENRGYSAGNNIGSRYAIEVLEVDYIIISNPDIIVGQNDILEILRYMRNNTDVAVGTGVIYNKINNKFHVFSCFGWDVPSYTDMLSNCFLIWYKCKRDILKKSIYYDYSILDKNRCLTVGAVPGCFFIIKKEALIDIGFFNECTFLYHEENFLGYALAQKHYKTIIATNSKVYHCEDTNKRSTLEKRIINDKRMLDSAAKYLYKCLKCNKLQVLFYKICFWLGRVEHIILLKLFGKLRRR